MTLRQKIEDILSEHFALGEEDKIKLSVLVMMDRIMNEISKKVYEKPMPQFEKNRGRK